LLQCLLLLGVWIGYGVVQWRRSDEIRRKIMRIERRTRVWVAILALVGGALAMLLGLILVQQAGGLAGDSLRWWAWLAIAIIGLGFVHAQTIAAAMMVTLVQETVTSSGEATSTKVEQDLTRE